MRHHAILARTACSAAVVAMLGFGAVQAVAAPARDAGDAAQVCNPRLCDRICRAIGAFGGTCLSNGSCVCFIGGR